MAKCVVCTHENAEREYKKHPNSVTDATRRLLHRRRQKTNTNTSPHRFCERHINSERVKEDLHYVTTK